MVAVGDEAEGIPAAEFGGGSSYFIVEGARDGGWGARTVSGRGEGGCGGKEGGKDGGLHDDGGGVDSL